MVTAYNNTEMFLPNQRTRGDFFSINSNFKYYSTYYNDTTPNQNVSFFSFPSITTQSNLKKKIKMKDKFILTSNSPSQPFKHNKILQNKPNKHQIYLSKQTHKKSPLILTNYRAFIQACDDQYNTTHTTMGNSNYISNNTNYKKRCDIDINKLLNRTKNSDTFTLTLSNNTALPIEQSHIDEYKNFLYMLDNKPKIQQLTRDIMTMITENRFHEVNKENNKEHKLIIHNYYFEDVLNALLRRVEYYTSRNQYISEDLVMNMLYEEVDLLKKKTDNNMEKYCKIKNFSSIVALDNKRVQLLPLINSTLDNRYLEKQKGFKSKLYTTQQDQESENGDLSTRLKRLNEQKKRIIKKRVKKMIMNENGEMVEGDSYETIEEEIDEENDNENNNNSNWLNNIGKVSVWNEFNKHQNELIANSKHGFINKDGYVSYNNAHNGNYFNNMSSDIYDRERYNSPRKNLKFDFRNNKNFNDDNFYHFSPITSRKERELQHNELFGVKGQFSSLFQKYDNYKPTNPKMANKQEKNTQTNKSTKSKNEDISELIKAKDVNFLSGRGINNKEGKDNVSKNTSRKRKKKGKKNKGMKTNREEDSESSSSGSESSEEEDEEEEEEEDEQNEGGYNSVKHKKKNNNNGTYTIQEYLKKENREDNQEQNIFNDDYNNIQNKNINNDNLNQNVLLNNTSNDDGIITSFENINKDNNGAILPGSKNQSKKSPKKSKKKKKRRKNHSIESRNKNETSQLDNLHQKQSTKPQLSNIIQKTSSLQNKQDQKDGKENTELNVHKSKDETNSNIILIDQPHKTKKKKGKGKSKSKGKKNRKNKDIISNRDNKTQNDLTINTQTEEQNNDKQNEEQQQNKEDSKARKADDLSEDGNLSEHSLLRNNKSRQSTSLGLKLSIDNPQPRKELRLGSRRDSNGYTYFLKHAEEFEKERLNNRIYQERQRKILEEKRKKLRERLDNTQDQRFQYLAAFEAKLKDLNLIEKIKFQLFSETTQEGKEKYLEMLNQINKLKEKDVTQYVIDLEKELIPIQEEIESIIKSRLVEERLNKFVTTFSDLRKKQIKKRVLLADNIKIIDNKFRSTMSDKMHYFPSKRHNTKSISNYK